MARRKRHAQATAVSTLLWGIHRDLEPVLGLGVAPFDVSLVAGMVLHLQFHIRPSWLEELPLKFDELVLGHEGMTAEPQAWREMAVRVGNASTGAGWTRRSGPSIGPSTTLTPPGT